MAFEVSKREDVSKFGKKKNQSLVGGHMVVHAGRNAMWKRGEMVKPKLVAGNLKPEHGKQSLCFTGSREILRVFEQYGSIKTDQ